MPDVYITGVDVVIGLAILVSAFYAAYRGLIRETLSIFAWAIAAYGSLLLYPLSQSLLAERIEPSWLAGAAALLGVFLIILIPLSFASHRFSQKVDKTAIGPVDRTLGFVFGVGRGLVIVALAYIVFSNFVSVGQQPGWMKRARLLPVIQGTSEVLLTLVPENNALRRHNVAAEDAASPPKSRTSAAGRGNNKQQGYGADERRALDRLIETTGGR
jgi:membrane protein required for colicin V production